MTDHLRNHTMSHRDSHSGSGMGMQRHRIVRERTNLTGWIVAALAALLLGSAAAGGISAVTHPAALREEPSR